MNITFIRTCYSRSWDESLTHILSQFFREYHCKLIYDLLPTIVFLKPNWLPANQSDDSEKVFRTKYRKEKETLTL